MNFVVATLNIFQNNLKSEPFIDSKTYEIQITTKPRDPRPGFIAPKIPVKHLRPRWSLKTSIFRSWRVENADLTAQSFEMDWYFYLIKNLGTWESTMLLSRTTKTVKQLKKL